MVTQTEERRLLTEKTVCGLYGNLLLATSYNLNKSHSKRISIGLENSNGRYSPIIKLSTAYPTYHVKFDLNSWTEFTNKFDEIDSYLQECYRFKQFSESNFIEASSHKILYQSSFKLKSIIVEEKLHEEESNDEELESQQWEESQNKRRKSVHVPSTCMQKVTFDGLKLVTPCIQQRLDQLTKYCDNVNKVMEYIIEYFKRVIEKDSETDLKMLCKSGRFDKYYTLYENDVKLYVIEHMFDMDNNLLNLILSEISAISIPAVLHNLETQMLKSE